MEIDNGGISCPLPRSTRTTCVRTEAKTMLAQTKEWRSGVGGAESMGKGPVAEKDLVSV